MKAARRTGSKAAAVEKLLERFCRYVKVYSEAVPGSAARPSSEGQKTLGRLLMAELKESGIESVQQDDGLVIATVPGNRSAAPTIAWLAHVDTSPDVTGKDVKPNVIRDYDGRDIVLKGDPTKVIRVDKTPELKEMKGKTLITTDGTTLLGADDKAGVAVVMTAVARLMADPERPRCPLKILFTCDEEIGRGADPIDIPSLGATAAYTLDGNGQGLIENETFSADGAKVIFHGVPIHPGLAYGEMVNAVRVLGDFLERLPKELSPECTRDREGFIHPYIVNGTAGKLELSFILRSFNTPELNDYANLIRETAAAVEKDHPGSRVEVVISRQYRNLLEYLDKEPRAVGLAQEAFRSLGLEPEFKGIRGGTDGSRLSERGLPTPNLSTGMHNYHSELEFACLEEMETAVKMLMELARLWAQEKV